jgi:hypothetical protein
MTSDATPLLTILDASQNGQLVTTLAAACNLDEEPCRQSLQRLVPEIARRINDHIEDDDDLEELVDILDEEEQAAILDDPNALFSRNAVRDGHDILELLYGSVDKAHDRAEDIGPPRGVDEDLFERLMTMAAALTFAAMARRNHLLQHGVSSSEAGNMVPEDQGFFSMIISALITGFMQGARQSTRRRRRRKRSILERVVGTNKRRRRKTSYRKRRSRRRRKTPSLKDIIGDILD